MKDRREQLLTTIKDRDPDLAAHLGAAFRLAHEPGGMNLKLAAHAVREFGAMLPDALWVARRRGARDETRLRVLAGRWAGLPQPGGDQENKGTVGLHETIEV